MSRYSMGQAGSRCPTPRIYSRTVGTSLSRITSPAASRREPCDSPMSQSGPGRDPEAQTRNALSRYAHCPCPAADTLGVIARQGSKGT